MDQTITLKEADKIRIHGYECPGHCNICLYKRVHKTYESCTPRKFRILIDSLLKNHLKKERNGYILC
jgi:hypothetical protein